MEQKVLPIILNGKDSAERMKEITDRLETGIQELFDSDRYKAYLTVPAPAPFPVLSTGCRPRSA